MRLTYLWIQRFGKLKEREFFLQDGINIIYGANESGKSTLHSFIRGMLFGMPRCRGRASRTDPYTRYEPWERPADYAGSMKFITGGKEFRIDRNFYKNDVREYFVCETDGEQLSLAHGDLEALLGGMSENIYDNTVSIGQLRSETDEGMVQELQNYMANFEGAGSGDVDVQQAVQRLKKKKKEWESRKQEQEIRRQRQLEEMDRQIQYISQERDGLENQLENLQKEKITVGNHAAYLQPTEDKVIYLTFDAGYENGNTPAILNALKKHQAPATFFVVGNFLETSPELVKQMNEEGHIVANHTYHHPDMSRMADEKSFLEELEKNETLYKEITGEEMVKYYRPPQGIFNTTNLEMASKTGYKTFFWSLAYVDWLQDQQPTKEQAFAKLIPRIHPGAIVLLHSTSSTNAEILDELLTKWEEMGYHYAPLTELAETL